MFWRFFECFGRFLNVLGMLEVFLSFKNDRVPRQLDSSPVG